MLAKWHWRFGMEKKSMWHRVVVARFWEVSSWETKEIRVWHGCELWKSIQKVKDIFWKFIRFKLGSRKEIWF